MDKKKVDMSNKEKAIELYFKDLSESEVEENDLDLVCVKNPATGKYDMYDDGSNPIFGKGHESEEEAWSATLAWIKEIRR